MSRKNASPTVTADEPSLDEEFPAETFTPLEMAVSAAKKKQIRSQLVWSPGDLTIDSSGTYATDGREVLALDYAVVRSLIRHYSTDNKGRVFQMIAAVKVTICGTDSDVKLIVLNGRQRLKAITYLNTLLAEIYQMWQDLGRDRVKLKNALVAQGEAGRNGTGYADKAWMDAEDVELLVGGRVSGDAVLGFLTKSKDSDEGPMPYCVRVEYVDVDPNSPEALEISLAERISVATPPLIRARQTQRLLNAGRTPESVAATSGVDVRTLYNGLLVLHVIPEAQQAHNEGLLSWRTLKDQFFRDTKRSGVIAKDPAEQKSILDFLLNNNAGAGRGGKAAREALKEPAKESEASPTDDSAIEDETPPVKPTTPAAAPPPAPPAPAYSSPTKTSPFGAPSGMRDFLPKAGAVLHSAKLRLPRPDADVDDADAYWEKREHIVQMDTAARILDYFEDPSALDELPLLKAAVEKALAELASDSGVVAAPPATSAPEKVVDAKKGKSKGGKVPLTENQRVGQAIVDLFSKWEDGGSDTEWPVTDDKVVKLHLGKIQGAYAAAIVDGDAPDKGDLAREYVMSNLLA